MQHMYWFIILHSKLLISITSHLQQSFWQQSVCTFFKMDDILDACFSEDPFTTPLHHSKQKKECKIESRNPWEYVDKLDPIYETHKVMKEEVTTLVCRSSYVIAPRDPTVNENDTLYHYFTMLCSQDRKFMKTWFHLFVSLNKQYFNSLAAMYLSHKGLTLDNWLNSVHDGQKGDILALLGLCLLIEKHALVHLKGGVNWTSLKNASKLHDEILK